MKSSSSWRCKINTQNHGLIGKNNREQNITIQIDKYLKCKSIKNKFDKVH